MGQVYTANGALNLANGAFFRMGANTGQMTFNAIDAAMTGSRIYEAATGGHKP